MIPDTMAHLTWRQQRSGFESAAVAVRHGIASLAAGRALETSGSECSGAARTGKRSAAGDGGRISNGGSDEDCGDGDISDGGDGGISDGGGGGDSRSGDGGGGSGGGGRDGDSAGTGATGGSRLNGELLARMGNVAAVCAVPLPQSCRVTHREMAVRIARCLRIQRHTP